MGIGKKGKNILQFVELKPKDLSINHHHPTFHKNTPHTDTSQTNKSTPSWSTMQESVEVYLIRNLYQILVLFCLSLFYSTFFFFVLLLIRYFFFQREGL